MIYKILLIIVILILLIGGGYFIKQEQQSKQVAVPSTQTSDNSVQESSASGKIKPFDFENKTFMIDDGTLAFKEGKVIMADAQYPTTIEKKATSPDGMYSVALIIDQPGGSGTYYYLVAGMMHDGMEMYSAPILLGDRIQFQKAEVLDPGAQDNGEIIVTYLDHGPNDPMSGEPTKQMTKKYSFEDNGNLIEVLR